MKQATAKQISGELLTTAKGGKKIFVRYKENGSDIYLPLKYSQYKLALEVMESQLLTHEIDGALQTTLDTCRVFTLPVLAEVILVDKAGVKTEIAHIHRKQFAASILN